MSVNDTDFDGKTALVVGGSSGIGNAIAQAYRTRGAQVQVWGTRPTSADYEGEDQSNLTGLAYRQFDMSDAAALEAYEPDFDRLDILVLCQGSVLYKRQEFGMEGFRKVLEVNLMSVMTCAMKFEPLLREAQGNLIIVNSTAAFHATVGNPAYNASKTGALGLTRTLARAWAANGVRVNGIAPGFIPTKMTAITTQRDEPREAALQRIPMGRFGTSDEMAGVALFLASPLAAYVTGQTIIADGGMLL